MILRRFSLISFVLIGLQRTTTFTDSAADLGDSIFAAFCADTTESIDNMESISIFYTAADCRSMDQNIYNKVLSNIKPY